MRTRYLRILAVALATSTALILATLTASAGGSPDRTAGVRPDRTGGGDQLAGLVDPARAYAHLKALEKASDVGGGSRTPGSKGFALSQRYVRAQLEAAGYRVQKHTFDYLFTQDLDARYQLPSTGEEQKIKTINFTTSTPVEGLEGRLVPLRAEAPLGCEAADFEGLPVSGSIALIKRGTCPFAEKQRLAGEAGAVGALIYNNQPGLLYGGLDSPDQSVVPTGAITQVQGEDLLSKAQQDELTIRIFVRQLIEERRTSNMYAETARGDPDQVLMVGAHLDSVPEGPGINDNGSGSGAVLELAKAMSKYTGKQAHKVRFMWWSAEEWGQVGSGKYLESLSASELAKIKGYVDLAKLGSLNYIRGYLDAVDEDGSGGPVGAPGSDAIQSALSTGLTREGKPAIPQDLNGSRFSDWTPFFERDIPTGGLFSGSMEGIKSPEEADLFGGTAGRPYDSCQHQPCDRVSNIDRTIFRDNLVAVAYAVGRLIDR